MDVMMTLEPGAKRPARAKDGDAGFDLHARLEELAYRELQPFSRALIPTGLRLELPAGYCGLVLSRSGLAIRHGIAVANAPGLIDSGYRGDVGVILENRSTTPFTVYDGDRIAQLVILELPHIDLLVVDELAASERGAAGFGSTGI